MTLNSLFCADVPLSNYSLTSDQKSDLAIRFNDREFLYQMNNSSVKIHFRYVLATSSLHMRRNSVNFAFWLNTALTIVFTTMISYKTTKIVAIRQHRKRVLGIFSPRMRRNSYLGTFGRKYDPAIRSGDIHCL